ncbi:zinc-finger-containing protein [Pseudomonas sp. JH-2]|uniref:zinc-finger-containing protein n=1 Tax=Pseudomonas sp. JH-2 TaxID=3114998 RepID=UPI002E258CF3|nr:zinc-finger-containing protein [Pseudomonas sp. JH-2]
MIDLRALCTKKLAPPAPLPYVSRKALKRVPNALPAPTICECGGQVVLMNNSAIYGREYGDWPYVYACTAVGCGRYVGLHPDTDLPLGTLADKPLRDARNRCKKPFERIWREDWMRRKEAYAWLAQDMGISTEECHFGLFSTQQCEQAKQLCDQYLAERE